VSRRSPLPPELPSQIAAPAGCTLIRLESFSDQRGSLAVAHATLGLPFVAERAFLVYNVPTGAIRGRHAHSIQHQLLIAASGSVAVDLDDGHEQGTLTLDHPSLALYLPPRVWAAQRDFSPGACLLVLASGPYDPADQLVSPPGPGADRGR